MLERRERLKLEDGRELRLLSALEVLEARREAEGRAADLLKEFGLPFKNAKKD